MLTYGYDDGGNLTSVASDNQNGANIAYEYDTLNRLNKVLDSGLASPAAEHTYGYDPVGNLESVLYSNGMSHNFSYDNRNRLTSVSVDDGVSGVVASYTYVLSPTGQRTQVTENSGRVATYVYDSLNRVIDEQISGDPFGINGGADYTYDDVGNRLVRLSTLAPLASQNFAYTANDEIIGNTYDANGNTTVSPDPRPAESGNVNDVYDLEDRLIRRTNTAGGTADVTYDAFGNRIRKDVNATLVDPVTSTLYLVDENNLTGFAQVVEELRDDGAGSFEVFRTYTHGLDLVSQSQLLDDGQGIIAEIPGPTAQPGGFSWP